MDPEEQKVNKYKSEYTVLLFRLKCEHSPVVDVRMWDRGLLCWCSYETAGLRCVVGDRWLVDTGVRTGDQGCLCVMTPVL